PPETPALTTLSIRPARPDDDALAIQAIYAPYVLTSTATFENVPPSVDDMAGRLRTLVEGGYPVLVAEEGGEGAPPRIVGYAYAGPYHKRPAYRATLENSIYVDSQCRRGGVGAALMTRLLAEAADRGFRQVIAVIADADNTASRQFHLRQGFREAGMIAAVGWKFGRWLDVFYYQITLGAGSDQPPADEGPASPSGPPTFR
ncbi:GNAT family N-acetyltransferase, partial [Rhodospirillum rubrum]|uniref:GNAT family N-acetyltransferase n=1 Tax=Rhodospirillum rubrum TaxID=1085 RepID=UPI0027B8EB0D